MTAAHEDGPALAGDPVVAGLLARCTFPPPGAPLVCAVSGGPDSLALLALAVAATALRYFGREAALVADRAAAGDLPFYDALISRHVVRWL